MMMLIVVFSTARGQTILLDGDFNSLSLGSAPDQYTPAGHWYFPSDYISAGLAENVPTEFTIVTDYSSGPGLQLLATSGLSGNQHLPNIFTQSITQAPGQIVAVSFDLFVYSGHGGGSVYLGAGGYGNRGPQVSWFSSGELLAAEGASLTLLGTYPRDVWQRVRLEVNLTDDVYAIYTGFRWDEHLTLVRSNLAFRTGPLEFLDRFTIARFTVDPDAYSYYDNISVEVGAAPTIIQQPVTQYLPPDQYSTNLSVIATGTPPLAYLWFRWDYFMDSWEPMMFQTEPELEWYSGNGPVRVRISNPFGSVMSDAAEVLPGSAPNVYWQPSSQTVPQGYQVRLNAAASGSPPPAFQWQKNGTNLPGEINGSLYFASVQMSDAGSYRVVASNQFGVAISSNATLTVLPAQPLAIIEQPASQRLGAGALALFDVALSGVPPFGYQWFKNGQPLVNATNASLALYNVQVSDAGGFSVQVTNVQGSVTSLVATLTVDRLIGLERVGAWNDSVFPHYISDVFITNGYAYVVGTGLAIFDLRMPTAPALVGRADVPGDSIFIAGDFAYVTAGSELQIVDISDPAAPSKTGHYLTSAYVLKVWTAGDYAYLAADYYGLIILDVSNPALPFQVANYRTAGSAVDVEVRGENIFVAEQGHGLSVINVSDAYHPYQIGFNQECANAEALHLDGPYAYVADGFTGLLILNVSDPTNPWSVARQLAPGKIVEGVRVCEGRAYLTERYTTNHYPNRMEILNVSNPGQPASLGSFQLSEQYDNLNGIALLPPYCFIADNPYLGPGGPGLLVLNVSNAASPAVAGQFNLVGEGRGVQVADARAYLAFGNAGLQIFDISNPGRPSLIGGCDTPGFANSVGVKGELACVADGDAGLQVISLTNPAAPILIGGYNTPGDARAIQIVGRYAYVADGENGLEIVDLNNPANPARVGGYSVPGFASGIQVTSNLVYLADGTNGLQILSVTNPSAPVRLGAYLDSGFSVNQVSVQGDYAYVADSSSYDGARIIDIRNPSAPTLIGSIVTNGYVYAITVVGRHAFLGFSGNSGSGLDIFDVGDPHNPVWLERLAGTFASSIQISNPYAYLAGSGLEIVGLGTIMPTPPLIVTQPQNRFTRSGQTQSFSAEARGTSPLYYQWFQSGSPIPSATNATLVLSNVQSAQAGLYTLRVVNALGTVFSTGASLVVDDQPPRVTHHSPEGDLAVGGSEDLAAGLRWVDFWFSEPINPDSLTLYNFSLQGPASQAISLWSVQEVGLNRFRVAFPPQTQFGEYRLTIPTNVCDLASNQLAQPYVAILNITPGDLVITNVLVSTNQMFAGELFALSWHELSTSPFPLRGPWTDAVYLSRDDQWDIADTRLGEVLHSGGLASNETYSAATTLVVAGVLPGNYFLLVRADDANQTRETVETNNIAVCGPISISYHQPAFGETYSGVFTRSNGFRYFEINLAAGQNLRLTLHGVATNAMNWIYASRNAVPSPWQYDVGKNIPMRDQQLILTASTNGGTYYVRIEGWASGSSSPFEFRAESSPLFVTDFKPAWFGNAMSATTTLTGAGFDAATTVEFIRSNEPVHTPASIEASPECLKLLLSLTNWSPGVYDIRVAKGTNVVLLAGACTLLQGGDPLLEVHLITPSAIGFNIPIRQTLWIEYTNSGNVAAPAPFFTLSGDYSARLTANRTLAVPRAGRGQITGVSETAQVLGAGSRETPGLVQPGESGRIPVYYLGLSAEASYPQVTFSLSSLPANDTRPIQWEQIEPSIRPNGFYAWQWSGVLQNLIARFGETWGEYHSAVSQDMSTFQDRGLPVTDVSQLWGFEVAKASAELCPVRVLASSVDASAPSPGFPLVVRRVYRQPIPYRHQLGALGRGWTHTWETWIASYTNCAVVHGFGGTDLWLKVAYHDFSGRPVYKSADGSILSGLRLVTADKVVWQFDYVSSRLLYVEDPNGNRITPNYTSGELTSLTHSCGKQLNFDYNAHGRLWHLTDPLGPGTADDRVTTFEYDASGQHLVRVTAPGNRITTYGYYTTGAAQRLHALTNVTYPDLTQDAFAYDPQGRLIQTARNCCGGAQQVTYSYGSAGTVTVTDATGRNTYLTYGLGGQLVRVQDGAGRVVNFDFDDASRLSQLLGPTGEPYRYSYDDNGNLAGIEDPQNQANRFSYEPNFNRLAQVTDARGNGLQYAYDARGNLTGITYADGSRELYAYNSAGNVVTSTNRRGQVITYAYNSAGQLTSKDYATTASITDFTYAYDLAGNLTNATYFDYQLSTQATINLSYAPATDRLTRIEYPGGRLFTFGHDAAGRRARRTDQDGNVTAYHYDAFGRLDRMTNGLGQLIVNYEYDAAGRLSRKTLGNGVFTTYNYNTAGQITNLVNCRADASVLSRFAYTYDASGRRDSMTTLAGRESYGYDKLGQLTSVSYPGGRVVTYSFDAAGNRTLVSDNGTNTAYSANKLNQYTSAGPATFGYDLDGNLTNRFEGGTNTIYNYDIENRLIGVATPTDTWTYTYDAFGNRVATTHNGQATHYVIDPTGLGNVAAEYDGGGGLIARYEHGFGLLARADTVANPAFYTFSAIGHTSELTDSSAAVANAYTYDPFGISLAKTELIPNPFEFVGEFGVMNDENGLESMRARFYSAFTGGFVQDDPIGVNGGSNFRIYGRNDPIYSVDPSGFLRLSGRGLGHEGSLDQIGIDGGRLDYELRFGGGHKSDWTIKARLDVGYDYTIDGTRRHGSFPLKKTWKGGEQPPPNRPLQPDFGPSVIVDFSDGNGNGGEGPFLPPNGPYTPPIPPPLPGQSNTVNTAGSFDPNNKLGPAGYGQAAFLRLGGRLAYQAEFENLSSATAPAREVIVRDTLDPNLDLSTLEVSEIAFGTHILTLPAGLTRYQAAMPLRSGSTDLQVDVQATLDYDTRTLTLTLKALDPQTGWYPEDPLVGLLPPEDGTGRGQGHISYLVGTRSGVASGTVVTNRARIWFDYNDPIDTPLVSNTIDAGAPTSSVAALPAEAGPEILVQWSGLDDAGGSGIANYQIFVATDGTNYTLWRESAVAGSDWFSGELGQTYAFYSVARDFVGNQEHTPLAPQAITTVPTNAPVLYAVSGVNALPGGAVTITNFVRGQPTGAWSFRLGTHAPFGASINPTNGILRWTPACSQGTTTNTITIWVTDSNRTNLTDAMSFTVTVGECVQPGLGRQILLAGDTGRVPIFLLSTVPLTSLDMTLVSPPGLLTDFNVETLVSEICETPIVPLSNALHRLSLITCPNQSLVGTQQVAWLNFTAAPGQTSAFLELQFTDLEGHQPDGGTVANFAPQSGRVVVVGEEPMLELLHSTNNSALLILYGKPLYSYQLESAPSLQTPIQWAPWQQLALTNLFAPVNVAITNQQRFYRAVRFGAILPQRVLGISVANSTNVVLACSGIAGRVYHVQFSPSLATPVWQTVGTATADNDGLFQITDTNGWRQAERYYRTIWP